MLGRSPAPDPSTATRSDARVPGSLATCRQYWQNLQGRCLLNFNWDAINHDSVVLVSASEILAQQRRSETQSSLRRRRHHHRRQYQPRHGPPFDPNHGVTFVITVDCNCPLEVVTDIIVLDAKPIDKGWGEFRTVRLPYTASGTDLGASTLHNRNLYIFFGDSGPDFDKPICLIPNVPPVAFDRSVLAAIGDFLPFEYRIRVNPSDPPRHIGQNQTPNGAFSYDGHCYVLPVYDVNPPDDPYGFISVITRSAEPTRVRGHWCGRCPNSILERSGRSLRSSCRATSYQACRRPTLLRH